MKKILFFFVLLTLTACILTTGVSAEEKALPFSDVSEKSWYYDAVREAYEQGLMKGKSDSVFDPGGNVTRAEFVTVLMRMSGDEAPESGSDYKDVKPANWFYSAVCWANASGIVNGYEDHTFRPNANIKRSEMATLIDRFVSYKSYTLGDDETAAASFPDVKGTEWFAASVENLRQSGLFKGNDKGEFRPNAYATRAETATLFTRLAEKIRESESDLRLPKITINTETGRDVESKEEYILCDFTLKSADGRNVETSEVKIRGRGNTAWRVDKKSYKLKFPEKVCLMDEAVGDTKAKDWTLLACHFDKSLIRNFVGYKMASVLDGIEWTPYVEMVEVYLNGEYRGVYMLSEQVEVNKKRVNIDDSTTEDKIGFLLELDFWSTGTYNVDYFKTNGFKYTIKNDFRDEEQAEAVRYHLDTVYNVICEGDFDKIKECVDLDSAIDMYLVNEVYKNIDVGSGSFYMYFKKPQGKLYFGPVWDLDGALGRTTRASDAEGLWAGHVINGNNKYTGDANIWFAALMSNKEFRDLVAERWTEIKDPMLNVIDESLVPVYENIDLYEKNFKAWPILKSYESGEANFPTCKAHIDYVKKWTEDRIAWLDSYFTSDTFADNYPADRSKTHLSADGPTDLIEDHDKWVLPEWAKDIPLVQNYFDRIYDMCEEHLEDGRICFDLGGKVTFTPENFSKVVLGEYMGLDTSRYEFVFDMDEFENYKSEYGGQGDGYGVADRFTVCIRDKVTGESSAYDRIIFNVTKRLSLNPKFGA